MGHCTRQESAEKQIQCDLSVDVYVERDCSLKKLAHVVMQAGNPRICRTDEKVRDPGDNHSSVLWVVSYRIPLDGEDESITTSN